LKRSRRDNEEKVFNFDPDVQEEPSDIEDSDDVSVEDEPEIVAVTGTKKGAKPTATAKTNATSKLSESNIPSSRSRGRVGHGVASFRGRGANSSPQFTSFRGRGS